MAQPYSHSIQYPSGLDMHESGTNLVQKKGADGEAPFSAALRDY